MGRRFLQRNANDTRLSVVIKNGTTTQTRDAVSFLCFCRAGYGGNLENIGDSRVFEAPLAASLLVCVISLPIFRSPDFAFTFLLFPRTIAVAAAGMSPTFFRRSPSPSNLLATHLALFVSACLLHTSQFTPFGYFSFAIVFPRLRSPWIRHHCVPAVAVCPDLLER